MSAWLCIEDSGSEPAPAAAPPVEDEEDELPPAALEPLEVFALGHEQLADGEDEGVLTEPLTDVSPTLPCTLVCSGQEHDAEGNDEDAVPPADALPVLLESDDMLPDTEGDELLLLEDEPDEIVPPAAELEVLGEDDWLVCAPWFIDEDEFTSVEVWFADTPEFVVLLPLPMFTPGLMFAPALMSVLLMPTFASTPTFGLT